MYTFIITYQRKRHSQILKLKVENIKITVLRILSAIVIVIIRMILIKRITTSMILI